MSKRVLAAFLVTLFIVATFATVAEVQAHYTLGDQTPSGPTNDGLPQPDNTAGTLGNHVPGHLAYVKPGRFYVWTQDQLPNYYSPEGAIITETKGGLTFYLNFTWAEAYVHGYPWVPRKADTYEAINITKEANGGRGNWLYIAIPPEFGVPEGWTDHTKGPVSVSTTITNDYATIKTGQFPDDHAFAPLWWYVAISSFTLPDHKDKGFLYTAGNDPYPDRQKRGGWDDGLYEVSVGGLTAPSIAGKYFFKVLYTDPEWGANPWESWLSIPPQNYPTLVVKGELDPGYISGRILYCGSYYYGYYYGKPIWKPGRVIAEGEAIDPVTNEPTGRKVMGWGYFNASANGFYEIEGLAPGIYKLTAEAKGFPPATLATEVTVKRGQSLHGVNIYVCPGAKIKLKVNSKCPTGRIAFPDWVAMGLKADETSIAHKLGRDGYPWAKYKVDIYDEEGKWVAGKKDYWKLTETTLYNGSAWFPVYFGDETSYEGADVVWDGHIPDDKADSISGVKAGVYTVRINVFGYVQLEDYEVVVPSAQYTGEIYREVDIFQGGKVTATVHFHNQEMPSAEEAPVIAGDLIIEAYDAEDTLRAWNYTHNDGTAKSKTVDVIGDPFAYYGMAAGTYTFKVWYPGYAQQEFPMHTLQLCTWNSFSFHLVKGANITVTVYSRDWQSPAQPLYWLHPPSRIRVYFYNSAGEAVGYAKTNQDALKDSKTVYYFGDVNTIDDYIVNGLKPFGLPTDVYSIKAFTVGYVQRTVPEVWAQKASSTGDIPLYLFAGASIFITVNFKIEELLAPLDPGKWSYYFRINVKDEEGNLAAANITSVPQNTVPTQSPAFDGVVVWTFEVVGFNGFDTPGKWSNWPSFPDLGDDTVTGFVPEKAFGYFEPNTWVKHYDYGIDAGTYTLEVIDETNGYVQTATVAVTVSLMGRATVYLDMHKQAEIYGTVYQRNYMGDFVRASWYTVELSGSPAATDLTKDGDYFFYAPAGTYTLKVHLMAPEHTDAVVEQERTVVVTWGAGAGGNDFFMEEGGIPIPEFPAAGVLMLISALAASLYLLRWRKQAIVQMP